MQILTKQAKNYRPLTEKKKRRFFMDRIRNLNNLTDEEISEMFKDYIATYEDKVRHTMSANEEVDRFDKYTEEVFPKDTVKQSEMYDKMMDVAVEYEESGFIAGVKWVLALVRRGCLIPEPNQNVTEEFGN